MVKNSPNKNHLEQKIDNLANAVAKGFEEVHQKIDNLDEKVDKRFTEMDTRFDRLEFLVSGHDRRIGLSFK